MNTLEACSQIVKELGVMRENLKALRHDHDMVRYSHEMEITRRESSIRELEKRFLDLLPTAPKEIPISPHPSELHVYREEDSPTPPPQKPQDSI